MKVLMNCLPLASGGGKAYLRGIVSRLSQRFEQAGRKHSLRFLTDESQRELFDLLPGSQCWWVPGPRRVGVNRVLWERLNVPRIAGHLQADVVFTPSMIEPRVSGVRHVLMHHNMEPFLFRNYRYSFRPWLRNHVLYWQAKRALRKAERVIAVSGFVGNFLTHDLGVSASRVRLIYHGRDTEFSEEGDAEADRRTLERIGVTGDFVLTCGSLLPYRRCGDVIAAFERSADSLDTGVRLVIAGAGTDGRYGRLVRYAIADSPCRERILEVGHVSREAMMALYRRCLVCIIASEIEACPIIAIEAMSSGCAIISSIRPPLPEILAGCSLEFRSRDVENMAVQIRSCLEDEMRRGELKARALERAQDFSWEKCAKETYRALVEW